MCEFISYIEVKKGGETHLLYLDDAAIGSDHGRERLKACKDNDLLGHGAIRAFYGPAASAGVEHELRNVWESDKLPKELQQKLKDFPTMRKHFGNLLTHYAQSDDLDYIIQNAPKTKAWKGLKPFCEGILSARHEERVAKLVQQVTQEQLPLTLGNDSVAKLKEDGKYNWANENVTDANFPAKASGTGKVDAILLNFGEDVTSEEVEDVAKALNLRLGTSRDGLHLGVQHSERQRTNWLVCLKDDWLGPSGSRDVVVLDDAAGSRGLNLDWRGSRWLASDRFLAFRK